MSSKVGLVMMKTETVEDAEGVVKAMAVSEDLTQRIAGKLILAFTDASKLIIDEELKRAAAEGLTESFLGTSLAAGIASAVTTAVVFMTEMAFGEHSEKARFYEAMAHKALSAIQMAKDSEGKTATVEYNQECPCEVCKAKRAVHKPTIN